MANINFYLRNKNSNKPTPITLFIDFDKQRLKIPTGEKVLPKYWNENKQSVKSSMVGSPEVNHQLDMFKEVSTRIYREAKLEGRKLNKDTYRTLLDEAMSGGKQTAKNTLLPFIDDFIKDAERTSKVKALTLKTYRTARTRLEEFQKHRKKEITFEEIDIDFLNEYESYLIKKHKYANNTLGKYVKSLKTFLNEATDRGLNKNMAYKKRRFKARNEESQSIYLNLEELRKIENLDLSEQPSLDRVRDLFLVGCDTGLRFSDFSNIKAENIQGNVLDIRTRKTDRKVVIPLSSRVRAVMAKYDTPNNLPPAISNQKFNDYIKEVGKRAGIDQNISLSKSKAGKPIQTTLPKYQLISSHTARRSFATNAYLENVPTISIMKITGHKTESSFLKYIKISQEENAMKLAEHPFFK